MKRIAHSLWDRMADSQGGPWYDRLLIAITDTPIIGFSAPYGYV